jgi:hypothetical protein
MVHYFEYMLNTATNKKHVFTVCSARLRQKFVHLYLEVLACLKLANSLIIDSIDLIDSFNLTGLLL